MWVKNKVLEVIHLEFFCFFFLFFLLFRAELTAYGSSQARGQTGGTTASLHHKHSKARSNPRLPPTSQLMVTPDP